jgi:hypothetical protein
MNLSPGSAPLNAPQPVRVRTDAEGQPVMVHLKSQSYPVQAVLQHWVEPPALPGEGRSYFLLSLDSGVLCCIFLAQGQWYRQRISQKHWQAHATSESEERADRGGGRPPPSLPRSLWRPTDRRP